jgi:outer membrane protein assembly factor BamB
MRPTVLRRVLSLFGDPTPMLTATWLVVALLFTACGRVNTPTQPFTAEWPMEGYGPMRNRGTAEVLTPPLFVQREYPLTDEATNASPVTIAGGLLFAEGDGRLHAVDLSSGEERWQINLPGSFLSPAVIDDTVYVRAEAGEEGYIFALTAANGSKRWQYKFPQVGSSYDNIGGHVTSPVVADGLVLVGAAQTLLALDANSGQEVWSFAAEFPIVSSAAIANDLVYFADFTRLYAVDLTTGQERWRFDHGKLALYFAPILVGDQVALTGYDTIYMLERTSGALLWSTPFAELQVIPAGASGDHLYVKSTNQLWALDLADGQVVWNYTTTNFVSLPAITDDQLYVITRSGGGGQVRALAQSSGAEVWRQDQVDLANAAPVIAGGRVYVRTTDGTVVVFGSS